MVDCSTPGFYNCDKKIGVIENDLFRCRKCDTNLTSNTPANQYQRVKRIYNTVGVPSSIYTMNLGALNAYEVPNTKYEIVNIAGKNYQVSPGVNWNQMSDRRRPHIQVAVSGAGTNPGGNSTKRTITRCRPGALSPGGSGVDIKHNSYDRYLNRIKGKVPLRRGIIPADFGVQEIGFNRAFPIYGGKVFKPSVISNCNCPIIPGDNNESFMVDKNIFHEQEEVLVYNRNNNSYSKVSIYYISYSEGICIVVFEDGLVQHVEISDLHKLQ